VGIGNDRAFINFIQRELRAGKTTIQIHAELLRGVSQEATREARALVKLSGAKILSIHVNMN